MRAVVDTNVIAYYLLGTREFLAETETFWQGGHDALAPALWEAEIVNVIWMAARAKVLSAETAPSKLDLAARLGVLSVPNRSLWRAALHRSLTSGVAAYDTLFVELADRESLPLVTFDERVLKAFPQIAQRPRDFCGKGV